MNVSPWIAPDLYTDRLAALPLEANEAATAVLVPALETGYDEGLGATGRMAAAVAAILTTAAIRRAWQSAADRSIVDARRHWAREARDAGILGRVRDPDLPDRERRKWRTENEERWALLRDQAKRQTERLIRVQRAAGVRPATIAADILANGIPTHNGRMAGRAQVIAADQLANLEGLIARHQQTDAGIGEFIWKTRGDDRVRDAHARLNGRRFKWDEPPNIGYPGEPIRCRCRAIGVVE